MGLFGGMTPQAHNPCPQHPCPHCDAEPYDPRACSHCAAIHYGTQAAANVLNTRPAPDFAGRVGRCERCGARTYDDWCPRAFCDAEPL